MKIAIALRTCTSQYNIFNLKRIIEEPKSTITLTCLNSLLKTIKNTKHNVTFSIHDDNSGDEVVQKMQEMCKSYGVECELFRCESKGNFKSQYEWMKKQDAEALYAVEDDYLHKETALQDMVEMIDHMIKFDEALYGIYPFNCYHRYTNPTSLYPSYVISGPKQYWRSLLHSTHTFFIPHIVFHMFDEIMKRQAYTWPTHQECNEDRTINNVWKNGVRLLCPLDSLAYHLEDETQEDPIYDWRPLWNKNLTEL